MANFEWTGDAVTRMIANYLSGAGWRIILTDSSNYDLVNPSMLAAIQQEIEDNVSYSRYPFAIGAATFDAAQNRGEAEALVEIANPAGGVTISFDRLVLLSGASATANLPVDSMDATANTISFATNPGLTNGDRVVLTPALGGVVPFELTDSGNPRILFVVAVDGNSVQLSTTQNGTPIDFGAGTLPIRARFANGRVEGIANVGSQQILPGQTRNYRIPVNVGRGNVDVIAL